MIIVRYDSQQGADLNCASASLPIGWRCKIGTNQCQMQRQGKGKGIASRRGRQVLHCQIYVKSAPFDHCTKTQAAQTGQKARAGSVGSAERKRAHNYRIDSME